MHRLGDAAVGLTVTESDVASDRRDTLTDLSDVLDDDGGELALGWGLEGGEVVDEGLEALNGTEEGTGVLTIAGIVNDAIFR